MPGNNLASAAHRFLWSFLLLLLTTGTALCDFTFDSWTTDSGLPRNSILGLVKARDGAIWLASPAGLTRFDGVQFRLFDRHNIPGLRSNNMIVFSLMEDRDGGIWAGTWSAGAIYYRDGVFRVFTTEDGLPNNTVARIDQDAEGTIWLYTHPGELATVKNGKLSRVAPAPNSPFTPYLTVPSSFNQEGYLWGLWRLSKAGWERFAFGKWSPFPIDPGIRDLRQVHFDWLAEDSKGRLWYRILSRPGLYYCLDKGKLRIFHGIARNEFISYEVVQILLAHPSQPDSTADPKISKIVFRNAACVSIDEANPNVARAVFGQVLNRVHLQRSRDGQA